MTDIIVVGAGPAGLTAAIYAARAGKSVLVLEKAACGGQIVYSPMVENYPAVKSISGAQFAENLVEQTQGLGVTIDYVEVQGFESVGSGFNVKTDDGEKACKALILAVGSNHRHLGLPGEEQLVGSGVSYCAVCDGPFYKDGNVAVIGGGDTAIQDALFLSGICRSVTVIHRRKQLRAEKKLCERAAEKENIEMLLGYTPEELLQQNGSLTGLSINSVESGETQVHTFDGVFIAIGQQPGSAPFAEQLTLTSDGYFDCDERCAGSVSGVFIAGDCRQKQVRQLTTAVGDGAVAALAAAQYIDGL